ncbi:MAG: hypothetical protein AB7U95_36265, partial [Reyranella sp.]
MRRILQSLCVGLALVAAPAHADLCNSVQGGAGASPTAATLRDVAFYKTLFPSSEWGNQTWNAMVLQCNRQRDTKGNEVTDVTQSTAGNAGKRQLSSGDLEPKVIRGHYNFYGTVVTQQKYVYILRKSGGKWTMIIPYKAEIDQMNGGSIDLSMGRRWIDASGTLGASDKVGHAWQIYEQTQVVTTGGKPALIPSARPIAETLCSSTTPVPGQEHAYDGENGANAYKRDRGNKHILLGKIQFRYGQKVTDSVVEGCRVPDVATVYWIDPGGALVKTIAKEFILDNFQRVAESYWSVKDPADPSKYVFELKLLLKGRNDDDFAKATLALLRDGDHLTAKFATQFQTNDREMFKSNPIAFHNFSTMTVDDTIRHEVGHAFGLDDEYGTQGKLNDCANGAYSAFGPNDYMMCDQSTSAVRTIYHYLAASRYVTKQSECQTDPDCKKGEYCDAGADLTKNSCRPIKADGAACALVGGGHQCQSGQCGMGRCYTPASVKMGGTCYIDGACEKGKCSSVDGAPGTCVCKGDPDCGSGQWCNAGSDLTKNACLPLKADGASCDLVGGAHQCRGGGCKFARCYTPGSVVMGGSCFVDDACRKGKCSSVDGANGTCVCKSDPDCGDGMWCDAGFDT